MIDLKKYIYSGCFLVKCKKSNLLYNEHFQSKFAYKKNQIIDNGSFQWIFKIINRSV